MRITVEGNNATANGLSGLLLRAGFQVITEYALFTVEIDEDIRLEDIIIDGVDGELEHNVINNIAELVPGGRVVLQRGKGNQSDSRIVIRLPPDEKAIWAVQQGVIRALIQCTTKGVPDKWWARLKKR